MIGFLKNFYLQIMEDEYTLVRSPVIDKAKWIEKLKYDVLRFSLDSIDFNLVEIGNAFNIQVNSNSSLILYIHFFSFPHRSHPFVYVCVICIQYFVMKV
jgi:hypothetical protein